MSLRWPFGFPLTRLTALPWNGGSEPLVGVGEQVQPATGGEGCDTDLPAELGRVDLLGGEARGQLQEAPVVREVANALEGADVTLDVGRHVGAEVVGHDLVRKVEHAGKGAAPHCARERTGPLVDSSETGKQRLRIVEKALEPAGLLSPPLQLVHGQPAQVEDADPAGEALGNRAQGREVLGPRQEVEPVRVAAVDAPLDRRQQLWRVLDLVEDEGRREAVEEQVRLGARAPTVLDRV